MAQNIFYNTKSFCMKYKEGETVVLKLGFYDEHDRKYIPKDAEGYIVNVMSVIHSYQVDFDGYALVMVPEEIVAAKMEVSKNKYG